MALRSDNRAAYEAASPYLEGHLRKRLSKLDRHGRIVSELRVQPALRVHELAGLLGVSTETIRRDLTALDDRGLINRTYGGAMRPVTYEPALAERQALMVAERERIAAAAIRLIDRDDILMIGGGATTLHFARRLAAEMEHLTVITHALSIAQALAVNPPIKVLMLPGQYDGREGIIVGADTIEAIQRYHANKAILGASGLTPEGPNDAAISAGQIYGAMMRRASETLILADHSKFDRPSLTVFGPWNAATTLISDRRPVGQLALALDASGVTFIEATAGT